jgi:sugar (pentulose or hexulose) kinase
MTAESIESLMGRSAKVIHVVGGGTKDGFLSQMTADACGVPVAAGPEEATAIGNLMMQLIAADEVADITEARRIVSNSFALKHYEPTRERAAWDEAYARFCVLN